MDIFINKKIWNKFTDDEMTEYENAVFSYYREHGFPYFDTSEMYRIKEFNKLMRFNFGNVLTDGIVTQSMHGLGLAWSYMPHAFGVQCADMMTPLQVFNDDELFMKVIRKRIRFGDNISDNGIRKMIKVFTGTQAVSNFRPTAAAAIYRHFMPNGGTVWDMSGGYGGRLLGSMAADVNYIATEPCTDSYNGLVEMAGDFGSRDIEIVLSGSECYDVERESLDFCFTSPPYFNQEKYSDEPTQSYLKYPEYSDWADGFLTDTFRNCYNGLKPGKCMAINIADVKKHNKIEEDTVRIAQRVGFSHINTYKLTLSKMHKGGFKYEPIFIFRK